MGNQERGCGTTKMGRLGLWKGLKTDAGNNSSSQGWRKRAEEERKEYETPEKADSKKQHWKAMYVVSKILKPTKGIIEIGSL